MTLKFERVAVGATWNGRELLGRPQDFKLLEKFVERRRLHLSKIGGSPGAARVAISRLRHTLRGTPIGIANVGYQLYEIRNDG